MNLRFQFEAGAVTLESGEVFSAAQHAADRWEVENPCFYAAAGSKVELLYRTADDQFISVAAHIGPDDFYLERIQDAKLMTHADARAWLQRNYFMLPDCLMKDVKTFPAAPKKQPKALEPVGESWPAAGPPAVNIGNWHEGGKAIAEAFKPDNGGGSEEAMAVGSARAKEQREAPAAKPGTEDAGGPTEDPHDNRAVWWAGKRIYLGNDTQMSRLFWLLAKPVGRAAMLAEVQRAIDGMETTQDMRPDEVRKADQRVWKVISKLRAELVKAGLDDHVLIARGGTQADPEYSMVWRFGK